MFQNESIFQLWPFWHGGSLSCTFIFLYAHKTWWQAADVECYVGQEWDWKSTPANGSQLRGREAGPLQGFAVALLLFEANSISRLQATGTPARGDCQCCQKACAWESSKRPSPWQIDRHHDLFLKGLLDPTLSSLLHPMPNSVCR